MKNFIRIIILLILDLIIIWFWIKWMSPTAPQGLGIILVVPIAFVINLVFSLILLIIKHKEFALLFMINSFICALLTAFIFSYQINLSTKNRLDYFTFRNNDSTFSILIWKEENEFDINYNKCENCSMKLIDGKYTQIEDTLYLKNGSVQYMMYNDFLYNFDQKPIRIIKK